MTTIPSISELAPRAVAGRTEPKPAPAPEFEAALARTRADTRVLVAAQRTPLTGSQAAAALEDAWRSVVGEAPDRSTLSVLTAHWAHETGRGQSMLNFNFAGIKGTGPSGLGASYRTREGWGATEVRTVDTFRAYQTAEEGARDYVSLLSRRYPDAIQAARAGDASGFVGALKEHGYFTGNEDAYRRNVTSLSNQALAAGFDSMGDAAVPFDGVAPTPVDFSRAPAFRGVDGVPFASLMAQASPGVDPSVFYDEIARATLRLALETSDDTRSSRSPF